MFSSRSSHDDDDDMSTELFSVDEICDLFDLMSQEESNHSRSDESEDEYSTVISFPPSPPPTIEKPYTYEWFFTPTTRAITAMNKRMSEPQDLPHEKRGRKSKVSIIGPHSDLFSTPPNKIGVVRFPNAVCAFKQRPEFQLNHTRPLKRRKFLLFEEEDSSSSSSPSCVRTLFCDDE